MLASPWSRRWSTWWTRSWPHRKIGMGERRAPLRVATRGSRLARWQAQRVIERLGVEAELVVVATAGDQRADVPIWAVGGTGVFVKELQQTVLEGRADLAVHSAKDL